MPSTVVHVDQHHGMVHYKDEKRAKQPIDAERFKQILDKHSCYRKEFTRFVQLRFAGKYTAFWLRINSFLTIVDEGLMLYDECEIFCKMALDSKTQLAKLQILGHHIVSMFIADGARYAVDLPSTLKEEAVHGDSINQYPRQTFDRIRILVLRELEFNFYQAFIKYLNVKFCSVLIGDDSHVAV